jgi:hypothetical protein
LIRPTLGGTYFFAKSIRLDAAKSLKGYGYVPGARMPRFFSFACRISQQAIKLRPICDGQELLGDVIVRQPRSAIAFPDELRVVTRNAAWVFFEQVRVEIAL